MYYRRSRYVILGFAKSEPGYLTVKLLLKNPNLCDQDTSTSQGQTDRLTDWRLVVKNTALCVASRGKNWISSIAFAKYNSVPLSRCYRGDAWLLNQLLVNGSNDWIIVVKLSWLTSDLDLTPVSLSIRSFTATMYRLRVWFCFSSVDRLPFALLRPVRAKTGRCIIVLACARQVFISFVAAAAANERVLTEPR